MANINYAQDPWYGTSPWVPPISEAESRVMPITPMSTLPVPPAPAAAYPEAGYSAQPTIQLGSHTTGYSATPYPTSQPSESGAGMDTWRYGSPADKRKAEYGAGSSTGSVTTLPQATRQVSRTIYTQPRPTAPNLPKLVMPKVNKRAIAALQQKHAASGVRKLRESLQLAMAQGSDNPNVRRMTIREALQGYGTGLESVMAGAYGTARSEHMADIQQQGVEAQGNWQAEINRQNAMYQAAINEYMNSATRITDSGTTDQVAAPGTSPSAPSMSSQAMSLRAAYSALQPYGVR
jgi:hypothetical protein